MTKEIGRNALKIGFPFIAIIALVMGTALPVLADNKAKPVSAARVVRGEVKSVASDNSTLVIQNGKDKQVTVKVDSNTKYFILSGAKLKVSIRSERAIDKETLKNTFDLESRQSMQMARAEMEIQIQFSDNLTWLDRYGVTAQLSDIQLGDKIIAEVKTTDNIATRILIIPQPTLHNVQGIVTAVSADSITIAPTNGPAVTLSWDLNTRFTLKGLISVQTGQRANALYNRITMMALSVDVEVSAPAPALETSPVT
jgi:hypothetical protein